MVTKYNELMSEYNFTNGIPKLYLKVKYHKFNQFTYLQVKLDQSISDDRREFIGNGIRSFFKDDLSFMLDMKDLLKTVASSIFLFEIFVGIVGAIALILAFFLLLISTTQNIKDNVWEFGVLRAMGLT